ncbi:MAG: transcriptional regulator [Robiginitomaculum sp.]|nr:MAG: transcriptional regulator [Robiginitomaculum sp.]
MSRSRDIVMDNIYAHQFTGMKALPLEKFMLQKSDNIAEVRSLVGDIFCPHTVSPKKTGRLAKFQMNHVKFGKSSSLNYLKYGSEVTIEPGKMADVFNVQVQLSGNTKTICGDQGASMTQGTASVLSPGQYVTMDWSEDASMLIYSVSKQAVEKKLEAILGGHLTNTLVFDTMMNCETGGGSAFWRSLQFLQKELEISGQFLNAPLAVDHFEQSLILSMLYGQQHNYSGALEHGISFVAPIHVKRVEDYIRANARNRITIEDLTQISGVSARTLFAGFKQFRGISPMKYLREVRMDFVQKDLLDPSLSKTVTEIAMRWGFIQLGRFSVEYKKKFGQSPSETMRSKF